MRYLVGFGSKNLEPVAKCEWKLSECEISVFLINFFLHSKHQFLKVINILLIEKIKDSKTGLKITQTPVWKSQPNEFSI